MESITVIRVTARRDANRSAFTCRGAIVDGECRAALAAHAESESMDDGSEACSEDIMTRAPWWMAFQFALPYSCSAFNAPTRKP
jgi:hypothetical protein